MGGLIPNAALKEHLLRLLGQEMFVALCQELGGTRFYVPYKMPDTHDVVQALGRKVADLLSSEFAPATIRVPLARRERALYYRAQGLSNARICKRLGMTENGVAKLFAREGDLPERPAKSKQHPDQLKLL